MISFNTVYQFVSNNERIRIIYVSYPQNICFYVFLDKSLSMPILSTISEIEKEYDSNHMVEVVDPYFAMKVDKALSAREIHKRDEYWKLIEKYWDLHKENILTKSTRMSTFQEIVNIENIPLMTVRRIFSRFWQRGMNRNAMLPDYANSGGKGKEKNIKNKNGRRRIYGDDECEGVIITDAIKKQFEAITQKYWRTSKKKSLREVYRLMLADFYSITVKSNEEIDKIIRNSDSIPSFNQYYYWFNKHRNKKLDIMLRDGEKEFELKHRPLLSNSTIEAPGPGFRFQIDATVADIYIVSEVDRSQIVGRPTVYIVIDVFSRIITGMYVGLESPSWNGAMMALDSIVANKVEFCKRHNIDIEEADWPCCFLPEAIIADRGELEGHDVENLINNLNITIENTSPYRGDYKGIVERFFRTLNDRIESFLPGAVMKDYRKRGDPDYRLEAKLTLKEITEIVIRSVLLHNIREIEKYPLTPEMIKDNVKPTPLDLWNWGIANKKGTLRKVARDRFRLNVMPRDKATISRGAVVFKNIYYGATELLDDSIYQQYKLKSLEIIYDPRNTEQIYWLKDDGIQYVTLHMLDRSRDFSGMFLEDVIFAQKKEAALRQATRKSQLQKETDLDQTIMNVAKRAAKKTDATIDTSISKSQRLKNIRQNRAIEKEGNRQIEAFTAPNNSNEDIATIIPFPNETTQSPSSNESTSDYNTRMMEKIRQRKEKLKNEKFRPE